MITRRSLLREALTASWIAWYLQRLKSRLLIASSRFACLALNFRFSVGRYVTPFLRALAMSRFAFFSEVGRQTMRVRPAGFDWSADASERSFGTLPPAAGLTEVSG